MEVATQVMIVIHRRAFVSTKSAFHRRRFARETGTAAVDIIATPENVYRKAVANQTKTALIRSFRFAKTAFVSAAHHRTAIE